MDKLGKVIQAFENCTEPEKCRDCPWEDCESADGERLDIPLSLAMAAMELLKAQEPRVMTLDELGNYKKPVWIEERESPKASKWYAPFKEIDSGIYAVFGEWCFMVEDYNTEWRPWTDVPTDEQREEVPWNA